MHVFGQTAYIFFNAFCICTITYVICFSHNGMSETGFSYVYFRWTLTLLSPLRPYLLFMRISATVQVQELLYPKDHVVSIINDWMKICQQMVKIGNSEAELSICSLIPGWYNSLEGSLIPRNYYYNSENVNENNIAVLFTPGIPTICQGKPQMYVFIWEMAWLRAVFTQRCLSCIWNRMWAHAELKYPSYLA